MSEKIDFSRSRAILVGTSRYDDSSFLQLPAAANSLKAMRDLLTEPLLCGWPAERVTTMQDVSDNRLLIQALRTDAWAAEDVLLLYYVGHGVLLPRGELCLTVSDTKNEHADVTGLEYQRVRELLLDSPARVKIVILDCCYSGRAIEALSGGADAIADLTETAGVYTLTASDRVAHVVPLEQQVQEATSFTDAFVGLVREGILGQPEHLSLSIIYRHLRKKLQGNGMPEPNQRNTGTADGFLFSRNAAVAGAVSRWREVRAATSPIVPVWYKTAVFYEVLIRAFTDSNGDGVGDLNGLTARLDYLEWLGVDCLIIGPCVAPLRGGGRGISDFRAVLPEFGTFKDFVLLLDSAHTRGIKIIVDLVLNHTSDEHPWFQHSRREPDGPYGDYYVWSDADDRYADARVIFVDTESSNWTHDPVRGQFFWHRFSSREPDLNYENPEVQDEMLEVLRFWFDIGVDGFRLFAVPYLFEQEGTTGESLPRTHDFLKRCRKLVNEEYPGRLLLAEPNQWPADAVEYFGDPTAGGDECHMAVHFPLMPRIFMAVRRESRFPISEILAQTPQIPSGCQWGIFLRNQDELTLEIVTDEERDYMWSEYAMDPRMKEHIGIRRRLAPLLENDRDQHELFTALLLSLPGSPVLYYGDEIGMGDNIWLADSDGVRTPMQWTPDRNAGFSSCDPGQLYLPVIMDPVYGYQGLNVEAQLNSSSSLLNWTRRMIEVRRAHLGFSLGKYVELSSSNPSVLAYLRYVPADQANRVDEDLIICVNNLSRFPQAVELDLSEFTDATPVELTGGGRFPAIGELPYLLTLPGYAFFWFELEMFASAS